MNKEIKKWLAVGALIVLVIALGRLIQFNYQFSYQKSQTVWQDLLSRAGFGKPDANVKSETVFLGDSITFQEDWNVLFGVSNIANAGLSGNTTDDVLARLDAVIGAHPQKLFLMIGINDLRTGKDVAYVFANYVKIVSQIRAASPETKIFLESVLPVDNDIAGPNFGIVDAQKIIDLNSQIKALADGNMIQFIDLYPYFCGADHRLYAKYAKDGLHLNSHGYAVWKNLIVTDIK
jgi:lysophospholipase L1-like esterase